MNNQPAVLLITEDTQKLLSRPRYSAYDMKGWSETEKDEYQKSLQEGIAQTQSALENLLDKISVVSDTSLGDLTRESNVRRIQFAIEQLLRRSNTMPTQMQIAAFTGLSRKTVQKHMEEVSQNQTESVKQYSMMTSQVMHTVLSKALRNDDLRAAKMYLDYSLKFSATETPSFVMVDNHPITQNMIDDLKPSNKRFLMIMFKSNKEEKESNNNSLEL